MPDGGDTTMNPPNGGPAIEIVMLDVAGIRMFAAELTRVATKVNLTSPASGMAGRNSPTVANVLSDAKMELICRHRSRG